MAEGRGFKVESHRNAVRLFKLCQSVQNIYKAVHRVCIGAVLCGEQLYPVKRTVYNTVAVNREQLQGILPPFTYMMILYHYLRAMSPFF